eukprot:2559139-Rhodomonas_salina.2
MTVSASVLLTSVAALVGCSPNEMEIWSRTGSVADSGKLVMDTWKGAPSICDPSHPVQFRVTPASNQVKSNSTGTLLSRPYRSVISPFPLNGADTVGVMPCSCVKTEVESTLAPNEKTAPGTPLSLGWLNLTRFK